MDAPRKLALLAATAVVAAVLAIGPAVAAEEAPDQQTEQAPATQQDEDHRRAIAETPRDRLGLLLLGSMVVAGGLAWVNARKQLRGERPQSSGEFRWR